MSEAVNLRGQALYEALLRIKPAELAETEWASQAGVNRGFFTNLKGSDISPRSDTLWKLLHHIGKTEADLIGRPPAQQPVVGASENDLPMVGIQFIEQDFGLGATFTNDHAQVDVIQFPKVWVETVSISPPSLLTWATGSGDSMSPTIEHGDMVLIDRSKTDVDEQDQLWAFTVGDTASIKRLRRKGDRYQIFSDNPSVRPDEEPIDFVRIVGRVVFVGKRK